MSSFKFPPPPPPPPKTLSNDSQQSPVNQRDGLGRGRGERGSNRRAQGRGRGGDNSNFGRQSHGRADRGGYANNKGAGSQHGRPNQVSHESFQSNHSGLSHTQVSGHVNAPFLNTPQSGGPPQLAAHPNALAQAVSFMATPTGQQAMAAFSTHTAATGVPSFSSASQPSFASYAQSPPGHSHTQHAGQKRKWEDRSKHTQGQHSTASNAKSQQGSKPPRAKAAVAPAVPSFGFSLPVVSKAPQTKGFKPDTKTDIKKGKVRLGLTAPSPVDESSDEESGDEEAILGAKIKGGGFAFEHKGEQISLQTGADIAAWIKDRRRNFPTQEKIIEKAEEAATKRKNEIQFIRRLKGKRPLQEGEEEYTQPESRPPRSIRQNEKKQEELAVLRKRLHESMLKKCDTSTTTTIDLGLGYNTETDSDDESSVLSESSVVSSLEDFSSEENPDDSDSDALPEAISSKIEPPKICVPPPEMNTIQAISQGDGICRRFKDTGRCPGRGCKYKHPKKEEKRESLFEKMVEQEKLKVDSLALQAIKFLGENGYLG